MALAFFDLDHTLLDGDSDYEWGLHLVSIGKVDREVYKKKNERFYREYLAGTIDIYAFLDFAFQPLANNLYSDLCDWRNDYIRQRIEPIIKDKGIELISKHRNAGDYLVMITATNRFITEPIKEIFDVDALIATIPAMKDGSFTGQVEGTPCFGEGKVTRVKEWLEATGHTLEGSYFYSDSRNDIPLLELVDFPFAVDADEKLSEFAREKGWKQISLL